MSLYYEIKPRAVMPVALSHFHKLLYLELYRCIVSRIYTHYIDHRRGVLRAPTPILFLLTAKYHCDVEELTLILEETCVTMASIINMSDFVYVGCFLFLSLFLQVSQGVLLDNNPYSHSVTLANGKYHLIWTANLATKEITFNVTVETRGYVGLGLARRGKMAGADIVIGGLGKDGKPYFRDYHAIGNQLPVEDPSQDWILHDAEERGGQTYLSFSRAFDTCDADHDLPISVRINKDYIH